MKILQVASGDFFSTYGGGQVYVRNIVNRMIDMGLDINIISFVGNDNVQEKIYRDHRIVSAPSGISESGLEDIIRDINPDIIHVHSNKALICRIGKRRGIPVVVTSHHGGILCPAGALMDCNDRICLKKVGHENCLSCVLRNIRTGLPLWYPFMRHIPAAKYISLGKRLEALPFIPFVTPVGQAALQIDRMERYWHDIAEDSTLVIAPSQRIADAMIENGLDEAKVRILPHGIPLPSSRPLQSKMTDGKIKFFYIGRICYVKGLHVLLKAFSTIKKTNIELHLIGGYGNKGERKYMHKLKKSYKHDNRIIWHGKISSEEIFKTIQNFQVGISVPVYMEIFGLNIAEALALGKPVLASRCGGAEMQIKESVNGWLVPPNDPMVLAEKINAIIENPGVIEDMSHNCEAISVEKHCDCLLEIYSNVLSL